MIYPRTYIAWDLETSGLNPETDKILEIGAIFVQDGKTVETKSWLLNHHMAIPEKITEITGITKEIIDAEGIYPKDAIDEFLQWFSNTEWKNLTHNGFRFDIPFLLNALVNESTFNYAEREDIKGELYRNGVDSAAIYKGGVLGRVQGDQPFMHYAKGVLDTPVKGLFYNITHCCKELSIDTTGQTMHRALGDVYLTNEIYKKLTAAV